MLWDRPPQAPRISPRLPVRDHIFGLAPLDPVGDVGLPIVGIAGISTRPSFIAASSVALFQEQRPASSKADRHAGADAPQGRCETRHSRRIGEGPRLTRSPMTLRAMSFAVLSLRKLVVRTISALEPSARPENSAALPVNSRPEFPASNPRASLKVKAPEPALGDEKGDLHSYHSDCLLLPPPSNVIPSYAPQAIQSVRCSLQPAANSSAK